MNTKYYVYNQEPDGEKYIEVTEEAFKKTVMETSCRFYIPFGTVVLECSEEEFRKYRAERNRHEYLKHGKGNKKVSIVSIETEKHLVNDFFEDDIIDKVFLDCAREKLRVALARLSEYEHFLIYEHFYKGRTQTDIANMIGETQQTISYQIKMCLLKLAELMT